MGGDNSKAGYSAETNEELLSLASRMYSLDEGARSLLTDELERRSIGPDEIQSYIDAEAAETSRPDPNSGMFAWIWPTIEDEKTAADASGRAIVVSAFAVFLGIVVSAVHLVPGLFSVFSATRTPALKLAVSVGVTALWALVYRGVVKQSPAWASVGLGLVVAYAVRDVLNHGWRRVDTGDAVTICLYFAILAAFISSIRGTAAHRKYTKSSGNQLHA